MRDLELLAPFGAGNPRPVFISEDALFPVQSQPSPFDVRGISLKVEDPSGRSFAALQPQQELWDGWDLRSFQGRSIQMAYSPVHRREGRNLKIELKLCDLKL